MEKGLPNKRSTIVGSKHKKSNHWFVDVRKNVLKRFDFNNVLIEHKNEFLNAVNASILNNLSFNNKIKRRTKNYKIYKQALVDVEPIAKKIGAKIKCDIVKPRIRPTLIPKVKPIEAQPKEIKKDTPTPSQIPSRGLSNK